MNQVTVVAEENAYDRVDRRKLSEVMREWIVAKIIKMSCAMMGPMRVRVGRNLNNFTDRISKTVSEDSDHSRHYYTCISTNL